MLIETLALIRQQGTQGIGRSELIEQLSAQRPHCSESLIDHLLLQLERKQKIQRTAAKLPCYKAGCGCSAIKEPWYSITEVAL